MTMLAYLLTACVLACPLAMVAMMWFMRGYRGRGREE
jgi:hypothetical protein